MKAKCSSACPLHGAGVRPTYLIGRRLERVVASWHVSGADAPSGPLDVWLIDSEGCFTHITTGSDWCLIVDSSVPYLGYDMQEDGRVEVAPVVGETPFADRLGATILAIQEQTDPLTGRVALEITFDSGVVRCESWSGDLRLSV